MGSRDKVMVSFDNRPNRGRKKRAQYISVPIHSSFKSKPYILKCFLILSSVCAKENLLRNKFIFLRWTVTKNNLATSQIWEANYSRAIHERLEIQPLHPIRRKLSGHFGFAKLAPRVFSVSAGGVLQENMQLLPCLSLLQSMLLQPACFWCCRCCCKHVLLTML